MGRDGTPGRVGERDGLDSSKVERDGEGEARERLDILSTQPHQVRKVSTVHTLPTLIRYGTYPMMPCTNARFIASSLLFLSILEEPCLSSEPCSTS